MTDREKAIIEWGLILLEGPAFEGYAFTSEGDIEVWKRDHGGVLPTLEEIQALGRRFATTRPIPIEVGGFVKTSRHGYRGRVTDFSTLGESDREWIEAQSIPLTIEDIQGRFVHILVDGGGAVMVPEASCIGIAPIENFKNRAA